MDSEVWQRLFTLLSMSVITRAILTRKSLYGLCARIV